MRNDPEIHSLEQHLSDLDLSSESHKRARLYQALKRQAEQPRYRQPAHVTLLSRLGSVVLLAVLLGAFWGLLRFEKTIPAFEVTALVMPYRMPSETPGTSIAGDDVQMVSQPKPLPTPRFIEKLQNQPVSKTGTLYP